MCFFFFNMDSFGLPYQGVCGCIPYETAEQICTVTGAIKLFMIARFPEYN